MSNFISKTFLLNSRLLHRCASQIKSLRVLYSQEHGDDRKAPLRQGRLKRRQDALQVPEDKGKQHQITYEKSENVQDTRTSQLKSEIDSMHIGNKPKRKPKHTSDGGVSNTNMDDTIESRSILLFPGQGSQFVGMGKQLLQYPGVQDLYESASAILGFDLLKVCLEGPKFQLDKTIYCQPAVVVTSLAALTKLYSENEQLVENCICAVGFSVGEISALIHSGTLSFQDGIELVKARAEAMQELCNEESSGMMTVVQNHNSKLKLAMEMSREYCSKRLGMEFPVCSVANYLASNVKVIAGHEPALEFIETNYKDFGIVRVKRLPVSGAFHTRLMYPAIEAVQHVLDKSDIKPPACVVFSNVNAKPYKRSIHSIKRSLQDQMWSPVKWEQSMLEIYQQNTKDRPYPQTIEVGPGKQLGLLLRQINRSAFQNYRSVNV